MSDTTFSTCPAASPCVIVAGFVGPGNDGDGRAVVLDPESGDTLGRLGPSLNGPGMSSVSSDGRTLVLPGVAFDYGAASVTGIDVRTGAVVFSQPIPPIGSQRTFGHALGAVSSGDASHLHAANDFYGIIGIDLQTGSEIGFTAMHSNAWRIARLEGKATLPAGTIVIAGARQEAPAFIYLLGPDLAAFDSIPLTGLGYRDVIVSPDERLVYIMARPRLVAFDIATKAIVHETTTESWG